MLSSRYFCYNEKGKATETGIFLVADERYYPVNQNEVQDRFYRTVFHYGNDTDGTASKMSTKVFAKGIGSSVVDGFALDGYYGVKQYAYDRIKNLF